MLFGHFPKKTSIFANTDTPKLSANYSSHLSQADTKLINGRDYVCLKRKARTFSKSFVFLLREGVQKNVVLTNRLTIRVGSGGTNLPILTPTLVLNNNVEDFSKGLLKNA